MYRKFWCFVQKFNFWPKLRFFRKIYRICTICYSWRYKNPHKKSRDPISSQPFTRSRDFLCRFSGITNSTYTVFKSDLTYEKAKESCGSLFSANLGSVHSLNYNAFITDLFAKQLWPTPIEMWIGCRTDSESGGWQWEDGSEVSFTRWGQGEPNNTEGYSDSCVKFLKTGDWRNDLCKFVFSPTIL